MTTTMPMSTTVTVLGLGAMGSAFARAFLTDGHAVTVWNRTQERAARFEEVGAQVATSIADAVAASPVSLVIVSDYASARAMLDTPEVRAALDGRVIINLTSDEPEAASAFAPWIAEHGAQYLDGRVGCYPRSIGTAQSNIIYAGDRDAFAAWEPLLRSLGSDLRHVGEDIHVANALAASMYSVFHHGVLVSYYEAAAMAARYGIPVQESLALARQTLRTVEDAIVRGTGQCAAGRYDGGEATLDTHAKAVAHSRQSMIDVGAEHALADAVLAHLERACAAGHGHQELSALFPVLSNGTPPSAP
jgi:3-hydroxyisobutyrate dehydrogenase-like beta-hydroxyacid dehydrogenase